MGKVYTRAFSDQNGEKTLPDGEARTNMAYIREYSTPHPPPGLILMPALVLFALYGPMHITLSSSL